MIIFLNNIRNNLVSSDKDILVFFAFFISVTLHELMHYIVSLLTFGKPIKFSILPKRDEEGWVLGSVVSSNVNFINAPLISLAPLLLLVIAYIVFLNFFSFVEINFINIVVYYFLLYILISNSIPSFQDIKVAFFKWYISIPFYTTLIFIVKRYNFDF
jgi:hypothetical protein